ncbi:MAG TPA: adenylyltransferase/cytidyltransferase family protein [Candidatus Eremiobacteraceae bacterium]|nr:adenylyltransferase/cytidyltransferase family protein [Candidatus Eremiobacteraceae bacterium]
MTQPTDVRVAAADKVLSREEIARRVADVRAQGGTVVFTCGVFDLLHVGHVRYLEFAREQGDVLVVGVNSDNSVRQLGKGADRPVVGEKERAEVVAALSSVTYVCLFDEQRPSETIRIIRPHVHVKDAAYEGAELPEAPAVKAVGGVIRYAPHVDGTSTSRLLRRIAPDGGA